MLLFRGWTDYEKGFGNFVLTNGEYWLGNKNLHYLTSQGKICIVTIIFYCFCFFVLSRAFFVGTNLELCCLSAWTSPKFQNKIRLNMY